MSDKIQSYYSHDFDSYRRRGETHREYSADFWEKNVSQILSCLKEHGLKPHHKILDLGAGGLRGGLSFIPYLDEKNYYAIDINKYLLEDGYEFEIIPKGWENKFPKNNMKVTHDYNAESFNVKFDYVWSFSLWTHLDADECDKCLSEVSKVLKKGGVYLTTCFVVSPEEYSRPQCRESDVRLATYPDRDPWHHTLNTFKQSAEKHNLKIEYCGIPECAPRKHDMIKFTKSEIDRV